MSDGVEQIPMPEFNGPENGPPPGPLTRQLSPDEERNVLLQFMGGQYGELNKLDQNIIGNTPTLERGKSEQVKQQITQLVQQPSPPPAVAPAPPPPPQPQPPVEAEKPRPHIVPETTDNPGQLTFDFDVTEKELLFEKIEKINSRVDKLHHKMDRIFELLNTKRPAKKKSVEKEQTS